MAEQLRDSAQFNGHQKLSLALSKVNDINTVFVLYRALSSDAQSALQHYTYILYNTILTHILRDIKLQKPKQETLISNYFSS